ncbi:hypothetical protein COI_0648 [Mannheimia haemolytica serotype A2 str. OVINE]|nr:hypothetical protein COI_0648 [Mannheimia haemolytica serotype A2 str. OVINE]
MLINIGKITFGLLIWAFISNDKQAVIFYYFLVNTDSHV